MMDNRIAFTIGSLPISWYGLSYFVGIFGGWILARFLNYTFCSKWTDYARVSLALDRTFAILPFLILIFARGAHILFYNPVFYANYPAEILNIRGGGMSIHGGFIGALVAVFLVNRFPGRGSFLRVFDLICCSAPLGIGCGRAANFISEEFPVTHFAGSWPFLTATSQKGDIGYPIQLYEGLAVGPVMMVLMLLLCKVGCLKRPGVVLGCFAVVYAILRTAIEQMRSDPQMFVIGNVEVTIASMLSIPVALIGILALLAGLLKPPIRLPPFK